MKSIEEKLNADGQQSVARLVAALPDEAPSLVWRSGLNEALRVQSLRVQRRKRFFFVARPMLGLATACALAVIVWVRPSVPHPVAQNSISAVSMVAQRPNVEAALVDLHRDDVRAMDVAGAGLNPNDSLLDQNASGQAPPILRRRISNFESLSLLRVAGHGSFRAGTGRIRVGSEASRSQCRTSDAAEHPAHLEPGDHGG